MADVGPPPTGRGGGRGNYFLPQRAPQLPTVGEFSTTDAAQPPIDLLAVKGFEGTAAGEFFVQFGCRSGGNAVVQAHYDYLRQDGRLSIKAAKGSTRVYLRPSLFAVVVATVAGEAHARRSDAAAMPYVRQSVFASHFGSLSASQPYIPDIVTCISSVVSSHIRLLHKWQWQVDVGIGEGDLINSGEPWWVMVIAYCWFEVAEDDDDDGAATEPEAEPEGSPTSKAARRHCRFVVVYVPHHPSRLFHFLRIRRDKTSANHASHR